MYGNLRHGISGQVHERADTPCGALPACHGAEGYAGEGGARHHGRKAGGHERSLRLGRPEARLP